MSEKEQSRTTIKHIKEIRDQVLNRTEPVVDPKPPAPEVDPTPAAPVVDPQPEPNPVRPRAARPLMGDITKDDSRMPGARWRKPTILGSKTNTRPGTLGEIYFRRKPHL
ncbi:MAG: hypothetical protein WC521_08090 [Bdellovibrionales bacterium]